MSKQLVAVYGSLLSGLGNHRVIGRANATLVGKGATAENFDMFSMGSIPYVSLAHSESNTPIVVEVYCTDEAGLTGPLDTLEGYPHFYNRTKVHVHLDDGDTVEAWIYHIDEFSTARVATGDWRSHHAI